MDKNPEDGDGDEVEAAKEDWEHRIIITGLVWEARKGWKVQTKFHDVRVGAPDGQQGQQPYYCTVLFQSDPSWYDQGTLVTTSTR